MYSIIYISQSLSLFKFFPNKEIELVFLVPTLLLPVFPTSYTNFIRPTPLDGFRKRHPLSLHDSFGVESRKVKEDKNKNCNDGNTGD